MVRALSLTMCLLLPMTALAEDVRSADAPAAAPTLTPPPDAAAPNPVTEGTQSCGMRHGCCARKGGFVKAVVITGVVGAVVTAVAVSIAVGAANAHAPPPGQVTR